MTHSGNKAVGFSPSHCLTAALLIIALSVGTLTIFQCAPRPRHAKQQFFRMTTMVDVTIATAKNGAALEPVWASIDSLLTFWEEHYSQSNRLSEVRVLNTRNAQRCAVARQLGSMVADAIAYGDTTGGLFDPTVFPVKNLWGLGETDTIHRIPSSDTLSKVLRHVDYRKVSINPSRDTIIFADSATTIDAGGFAKGYALIETARLLEKRGFADYLVTSGDVVAKGRRSDGQPWRIGIMHPRKENSLIAVVQFDTGSIFTSGDYENFWLHDTRRIHHIFNPRTGRSCTNNQSVTIASTSAIEAKYLSTGLFCMPADSIVRFAEKRGLNCFVVDSAGKTYISAGWKNNLSLQNENH